MNLIFKIFTTREIALIFWLGLLFLWFFQKKEIRKSFWNVIKSFFKKQLIIINSLFLLYITGVLFVLKAMNLWTDMQMKDTVFWFFSIAIGMFMKVTEIHRNDYFRNVVLKSLKWIIILEFIINFYTFSLITELILMPIVLLTVTTQAFADIYSRKDKMYVHVNKLLGNFLSIIGIIFFLFSLYKTIYDFDKLVTLNNLRSFLLPIILTISISPIIYLIAVYMNYESLFVHIGFFTNDKNIKKKVEWAIVKKSKLNIRKITDFKNKISRFDFYESENLDTFLNNY